MHSKTKKVEWLAWKVQSEVGGHEEGEKVGWHQSGKVIYVISSINQLVLLTRTASYCIVCSASYYTFYSFFGFEACSSPLFK